MAPPRTGEGDRPQGGGGAVPRVSTPLPSAARAAANSPSRGGSVALAAVAGAHGIRGEVRLKLFSDSLDSLAAQSVVDVGGTRLRLLSVRAAGKGAVARFEGIADRGTAEGLRGSLIAIDRASLPPLGEGEYYHADLIGLPCVDGDGALIGTVVAVENYGAGDLLEIARPAGQNSLIPFKPGVADLAAGRITLDPDFLA